MGALLLFNTMEYITSFELTAREVDSILVRATGCDAMPGGVKPTHGRIT